MPTSWIPGSVRRRLDGLHRVSDRLQRLGEHQDVVQGVVDAVEEHLGYEYGAVLLLDPLTGLLAPRALSRQGQGDAFVEADKRYVRARVAGDGRGIAAWVARTGSTVRSGDIRRDPRYLGLREGIRSELCVPMRARGRIVGVFNTETTRRGAYLRADQQALEIVAGELALAILAERSGPTRLTTRCSWCGRVRDADQVWRAAGALDPGGAGQAVTHGICPECLERHFPE